MADGGDVRFIKFDPETGVVSEIKGQDLVDLERRIIVGVMRPVVFTFAGVVVFLPVFLVYDPLGVLTDDWCLFQLFILHHHAPHHD